MPAARYWRIIGIETYGGGDLELSEVALYSGGTRMDGSAALTSSHAPTTGSLANLKDSDTGTTARFAGADVFLPGFVLQWDFGSDQVVEEIGYRSPSLAEFMHGFTAQYSPDNIVWTSADSYLGIVYPGAGQEVRGFFVSDPTFNPVDPFEAQVVLRLRMEDAIGSATLVDTSPNPKTVTIHGAAGMSTTRKHGERAFYTPSGAGNGAKISQNVTDFSFGTGDFTIEMWARGDTGGRTRAIGFSRNRDFLSAGWYVEVTGSSIAIGSYGGQASASFSTTAANTTDFTHIAFCRASGVIRGYVNGVLVGTKFDSANLNTTADVANGSIGAYDDVLNTIGTSYYDDVRITKAARYTTSKFSPPGRGFLSNSSLGDRVLRNRSSQPTRISEYTPPATVTSQIAPAPNRIDIAYGGTATVAGTVKKVPNVPLRRRVRLYDENGRQFIREVWSDAVTGEFVFTDLNPAYAYTVITYDYENNYRALTVDKVVAV